MGLRSDGCPPWVVAVRISERGELGTDAAQRGSSCGMLVLGRLLLCSTISASGCRKMKRKSNGGGLPEVVGVNAVHVKLSQRSGSRGMPATAPETLGLIIQKRFLAVTRGFEYKGRELKDVVAL